MWARQIKVMRSFVVALGWMFTIVAIPVQDGSPPVLDPSQVFSSGVQVVKTLPVVRADNDSRRLYYLDSSSRVWKGYPYPADLAKIAQTERRSDGTFLVSDQNYQVFFGADAADIWLFNPASGEIERPPTICETLAQALPGEGHWWLTKSPKDHLFRLCNTETGAHSQPLPGDLQSRLTEIVCGYYFEIPVTSPDGKWVLFSDCPNDNILSYTFYAYEVATGRLNHLGSTECCLESLTVNQWVDNTRPIIRNENLREAGVREIYIADVTRANSLKSVAGQSVYRPAYLESSSRIRWSEFQFQDYYEYNLQTGEKRLLYHGNFSKGCDVNRDPLCDAAWVLPTDNDLLGVIVGYPVALSCEFTVYDLETSRTLYHKVLVVSPCVITTIQGHIFLFWDFDVKSNQDGFRRIQIEDAKPPEVKFYPLNDNNYFNLDVSPDQNEVMLWDQHWGMSVLDLAKDKTQLVVSPIGESRYMDAEWKSADTLQVNFHSSEANCYPACDIGSWIVRVA